MVKRALEGAAITGSGFQCRQCRTLIVARSRRDRIPARPGSRGASHRSGAGPGTVDDQSGGDQKPNHWPVCALARAGADLGKGSPAKSPEAGRVSVTGTGHRDAHRSVQPGTGCGSTESRASGESGDAGVTRDDLPGPLRARSWIVALGSCRRVAVRAGNTATAEAGGSGILENVAAELNRRPRTRHGYRTPAEVLATLISNRTNQTGVAHTT